MKCNAEASPGEALKVAAPQAFDIFISAAQHAVSAAENQAASAQAGAKEVGELVIGFAERNIASSFAFAQKLLQAKDPNDVVALHTDYVNRQIATLTEQGQELSSRAAKMGGQHPSIDGQWTVRALSLALAPGRLRMAFLCIAIFFIAMHQKWGYKRFT